MRKESRSRALAIIPFVAVVLLVLGAAIYIGIHGKREQSMDQCATKYGTSAESVSIAWSWRSLGWRCVKESTR
jgi:hypothetical protein